MWRGYFTLANTTSIMTAHLSVDYDYKDDFSFKMTMENLPLYMIIQLLA